MTQQNETVTLGAELLPRHTDTESVIEGKIRRMVRTVAERMETMEMPQSTFMLVIGFDAQNYYSSVIAHYVLMHKMLPKLPGIIAEHKLTMVDASEWLPGVLVVSEDLITPALSIKCKMATADHGDQYSDFILTQAKAICDQALAAQRGEGIPEKVEAAMSVTGAARKTRH